MATITLPTNGQSGWGTILNTAVSAINTQLETLVPVGNSLIRATTSAGALSNLTYNSTAATANTIVQRGSGGVIVTGTPTATTHATTKAYVDAQIALQATLPTGTNQIPSTGATAGVQANTTYSKTAGADTIAQRTASGQLVVAAPTSDDSAATKLYVDTAVAGGGGGGGAVSSVNTKTGAVVLNADDVGAYAKQSNPAAASVFVVNSDGSTSLITYSQAAGGNTIARRESTGHLNTTQTPTSPGHAASKAYVDGLIALQATIPASANQLVGSGSAGVQQNYPYSQSASADSIARRSSSGQLAVATPTVGGNAANKDYVDATVDTYNVFASGGTYPTVPATSPNAAIKIRHFYGPTQPSVATWSGVLDLYTHTD